jgi:hypothetical protein
MKLRLLKIYFTSSIHLRYRENNVHCKKKKKTNKQTQRQKMIIINLPLVISNSSFAYVQFQVHVKYFSKIDNQIFVIEIFA